MPTQPALPLVFHGSRAEVLRWMGVESIGRMHIPFVARSPVYIPNRSQLN